MLGTSHTVMQSSIPGEHRPQVHHCECLKTCMCLLTSSKDKRLDFLLTFFRNLPNNLDGYMLMGFMV